MTDATRPPDERRPRRRWRLAASLAAVGVLAVAAAPFWGPVLMRRMAFFRVRKVEIVGARYVSVNDVLDRLRVDTTASVWDPTSVLERRLAAHPQVRAATVHRKLPGTLVVRISEHQPVALVPGASGFRAYDARGVALPMDLARTPVDAPVVAQRDVGVLQLLGLLRSELPALYARVSEVRPAGNDELIFVLADVPVRTMRTVTIERLTEIAPVEDDLARRQLRAAEIDLRYRDQVIARLP
jgi:cell division protein FtsQ